MKIDFGPKINPVQPETTELVRDTCVWLATTASMAEGRDFFGKVSVEIRWQAGQAVSVERIAKETDQ